MKKLIAVFASFAAAASVHTHALAQAPEPGAGHDAKPAHWSYGASHGGPAKWSELSPDYAACGVGKHQSPIDIKGAKKADLPPIQLGYQPSQPSVVNNGHTIQVNLPPGNSITVGDHKYDLAQFHFHTPSEEAVSGKRAPLVAHFVHKDADGKLAVVAVLFDVGAENAALAPVFANLPAEESSSATLAEVKLDPAAVLPAKRGYYEFEGSLTTPPCSEGVRWLVLQQRSTISKAQLAAFQKLYPANARPLQPLNGREIRASK
jgi:carbonic anhydrase